MNLKKMGKAVSASSLSALLAFAVLLLTLGIFTHYGSNMDLVMNPYDWAIFIFAEIVLTILAQRWPPFRNLLIALMFLSVSAIWLYQGQLARAESAFWLKYFLSSQSGILWMSLLFILATFFYWIALLTNSSSWGKTARFLCWAAVLMGLTALLVRWHESYLIGPDIGHIPISNLYEVFVLFSLITALFYLYYEERYQTWNLGAFVLLVISAAIGFLLWYSISRGAYEIQPLVPALQSWWMKLHVPANFIGYGTFALAAMVAVAYLLKLYEAQRYARLSLDPAEGFFAQRLPSLETLDDLMYKAIAVGFAFFTIATVLGALWAAQAWGGYWSWDPKETWALIVWLNYAAWLHMRLIKGLRGSMAAWWALTGLLITTFAFLGVNMFLSGLHSYGRL